MRNRAAVVQSLAGLAFALVAIQLVPTHRANPPIGNVIDAPDSVLAILRRSCWDCHSNETQWPWYAYVAPVSWLVVKDVRNGRADINLTEWPLFGEEPAENRELMWQQIDQGKMPLKSYVLLHPSARLSEADIRIIRQWVANASESVFDPLFHEIP